MRCSTFTAKEQLARGGSTLLPSFAVLLGPASTTSCTLIQRKAFPFLASGLALVCLPSQIIPRGSVGATQYTHVWHDCTHLYLPIHISDNTGVLTGTKIVWKYVELNRLPVFNNLIQIVHTFVQYQNNTYLKARVGGCVMRLGRSSEPKD